METLSICYVSFSFFPSQGATVAYEYPKHMAEVGHEVTVVTAGRKDCIHKEYKDNLKVIRVPLRTTRRLSVDNPRFSLLAGRTLTREFRDERVEIIHVFSYAGSLLLKFISNLRRPKWIYDVTSGAIRRIFSGNPYVFSRFESSFYDAVFLVGEDLPFKQSGKVFWRHQGVDLDIFRSLDYRDTLSRYGITKAKDDIVYAYLGSLGRERRLENMILAFYEAMRTRQSGVGKMYLVLIGEQTGRRDLKLLVEKIGISNQVIFIGYVPYRNVPVLLAEADVGISYVPITPEFYHQPPLKTLEYLACSLPVIATNTLGNRKYVAHFENGLLTDDNIHSIAKAILKMANDKRLRKTLSNRARSSVAKYEWKNIVRNNLIPSYRRILE